MHNKAYSPYSARNLLKLESLLVHKGLIDPGSENQHNNICELLKNSELIHIKSSVSTEVKEEEEDGNM